MKRILLGAVLLSAACNTPCAKPGEVCTVAGVPEVAGFNGEDLDAHETWLYHPCSLAFDADGALIIADANNNRVRRLEGDGTLSTVAGDGRHAGAIDGALGSESPLEYPVDLSFAPDGALVMVELHTSRLVQMDASGVMWGIAGSGDPGFTGDGGPAASARLASAAGVTVDDDGTIYVADTDNHVIRKVSPEGRIDRVAGDGLAGFVDGAAARFNRPQRLRIDGRTLYVADAGNHAVRAVELDSGEVRTVVGTGTAGFSGDGGPAVAAQLNQPFGLLPDGEGGLWVADSENHRIRHVDAAGDIATYAGNGEPAWAGDDGPAADASFFFPVDLLLDERGGLYVGDLKNQVVRYVAAPR